MRAALSSGPYGLPPRKQVVNLAPADRRKDSPGLDLAIACSLLAAHGAIPVESLEKILLWAELGLDGRLRPVSGTLVVADGARRSGFETIVVAPEGAEAATSIPLLKVWVVENLQDLVEVLQGKKTIEKQRGGERPVGSLVRRGFRHERRSRSGGCSESSGGHGRGRTQPSALRSARGGKDDVGKAGWCTPSSARR